jgi:predicted nucleic acid-binding protein
LIKLAVREPESDALRAEVDQWAEWASSRLAEVELRRAVRRLGSSLSVADRERMVLEADRALKLVALFDIDRVVVEDASGADPIQLRTLDAIHVATARLFGKDLGGLLTYDRRMADAARAAGLPVLSPA